jgi:hypothetical protein
MEKREMQENIASSLSKPLKPVISTVFLQIGNAC